MAKGKEALPEDGALLQETAGRWRYQRMALFKHAETTASHVGDQHTTQSLLAAVLQVSYSAVAWDTSHYFRRVAYCLLNAINNQ